MTLDELIERFECVKRNGTGFLARCPAHEDRSPSLSITEGDGKLLLHCFAGCSLEKITAAAGIRTRDLFTEERPREQTARRTIEAVYPYHDEAGSVLFEVVRFRPKDFRQRRPDGRGGHVWSMAGVRKVLFGLPAVLQAVEVKRHLYIVEGEKDVEALRAAGEVATCNPGGAGKWQYVAEHARKVMAGACVLVVADRDEPGRRHAREVVATLRDVVAMVALLEPAHGKDVAEHLGAGLTVDDLIEVDIAEPGTGDAGRNDDDDDEMVELVDWTEVHDPTDDIVDGFIVPGRWVQIPAPAKVGKSTLLVSTSLDLSEGRDPFDSTPIEPVVVLYADGEMGRDDLEELVRSCGYDPVKLTRWHATVEQLRLDTVEGAARLLRRVDRLGARLVVLDGLNGFVDPAKAEKDDTTWRPFFDLTIMSLKRRGVAVVSGDNMGKNPTLGSRGSSVKTDKADAVFELRRLDSGARLHMTHGRGGAFAPGIDLDVEGIDRSVPIRYRRTLGGWPSGTKEAADLLDRLGVPVDEGRRKVRARLRELIAEAEAAGIDAGEYRIRNDVLAAALRYRKAARPGTVVRFP